MLSAALSLLLLSATAGASGNGEPGGDKGLHWRKVPAPDGRHRVALVIGNGAYAGARLNNPARDAKAVSEALAAVGFDVETRFDLDRAGMIRALRAFSERLTPDAVALFYYSGHGVTHDGRSYMLPVATRIRAPADVELEAVDLQRVTARLQEAGSRLNFVVLDACRNSPVVPAGTRGSGSGLAFVTAPTGTLIAYATAPGGTAADGDGHLSPYTAAFVDELKVPGRPVEEMFKAVRRRVRKKTQGAQVPWESSSLEGRFVFVPEGKVLAQAPARQRSPSAQGSDARSYQQQGASSEPVIETDDEYATESRRRRRQRKAAEVREAYEAEEARRAEMYRPKTLEERYTTADNQLGSYITALMIFAGISAPLTIAAAGSLAASVVLGTTLLGAAFPTASCWLGVVGGMLCGPAATLSLFTGCCTLATINIWSTRNDLAEKLQEQALTPPTPEPTAMAY